MNYTPIKEPIPPRIEDDRYDKLMRKIWEMQQELAALKKSTLDSVSLEQVFSEVRDVKDQLESQKFSHDLVLKLCLAIINLENKKSM